MRGGARLIVTADDFGADVSVNEAVEFAHRQGILTAASLMVAGAAAADAVRRARAMPRLGVGLHIVLADGAPILPPAQVSRLVGPDGRFPVDMLATALKIAFDPRARAQMRAEVAAQFAAFAATGLAVDHVNAHKHFHLHPMIAGAIVAEGRKHGLAAIRVPAETAPRSLGGRAMAWWARRLARRWRAQGLATNDAVIGLAQSGAFDTAAMVAALEGLKLYGDDALVEIYTHPASADHWPGSAPGYRYRAEMAALIDPRVCVALKASGVVSGRFADFAPVSAPVDALPLSGPREASAARAARAA